MDTIKFEKEPLFRNLVSNSGMNLYLGAGFSVGATNGDGQKLPLGGQINETLIEMFSLDKDRGYELSKTCQKIKRDNEDALNRFLRETYTVKKYDDTYRLLPSLPIKNIVTLNIDNLIEKVYEDNCPSISLVDSKMYGSLEKTDAVNIYKLHGSVTYTMSERLSFTEKEVTDLFIKEKNLFSTVSYKLSAAPTLFWGTSLNDNNTLELICSSEEFAKAKTQKWIVVYPCAENEKYIDDFRDLGFNIIEADTLSLIQYLSNMDFGNSKITKVKLEYEDTFPNNYVCAKLKKTSVRRPVVDFFAGAEPQISDVLSANVIRTSYFNEALNKIASEKYLLITGIPGCGKSTLLLQMAFSDEVGGTKFWFSSITKQEAERLERNISKEKGDVTIFIDNLYNNLEAFKVLSEMENIKIVMAERALNFEYVKRSLKITSNQIIDISNLNTDDVQTICKKMNRLSDEVISLVQNNDNISLLEIVFFASTRNLISDRITGYVNDLRSFDDPNLKVNLLELFALVNYTSYCGVPCSMDMMLFYFGDDIDDYNDLLYALKKMNQIIVDVSPTDEVEYNQDYLAMRSKLFAEKSVTCIDKITMGKVLNQFWDKISYHIIYRYDVLKKRAFDADLTTMVFNTKEGSDFYEKMLTINDSPFVKHQYAIFYLRKKKYDKAWELIDQAYTESEKKVFTIANTHAVILFEKNIVASDSTEEQTKILKETIKRSFDTLGYCITQDIRINYHVLVYSRNALRYYERFGIDEYTPQYVAVSLSQLDEVLNSSDYMYFGIKRELLRLKNDLKGINI